jgi:peptidoglycan hydrolase-like protein with peptidoglycan-binding domain
MIFVIRTNPRIGLVAAALMSAALAGCASGGSQPAAAPPPPAPAPAPAPVAQPAPPPAPVLPPHATRQQFMQAVQTALNNNGAQLTADGHPGPKTSAALVAFQKAHNLKPTGRPDHATVAALGLH